jgi:hypothetical protein
MEPRSSAATIGRTVVVGGFLVALVLVGRPVWLAVLLGVLLIGVWTAPFILAPPRRQRRSVVRVLQQKRARPG